MRSDDAFRIYDADIYSLDDFIKKINPILEHIWPILDEFYSQILMIPDNNFDFTYNGVVYKPTPQVE